MLEVNALLFLYPQSAHTYKDIAQTPWKRTNLLRYSRISAEPIHRRQSKLPESLGLECRRTHHYLATPSHLSLSSSLVPCFQQLREDSLQWNERRFLTWHEVMTRYISYRYVSQEWDEVELEFLTRKEGGAFPNRYYHAYNITCYFQYNRLLRALALWIMYDHELLDSNSSNLHTGAA